MEFKIIGVVRETGKRRTLTVRANTREEAEAEASRWGLTVDPSQEPVLSGPSTIGPPEYLLARIVSIGCFVMAVLCVLGAAGGMAEDARAGGEWFGFRIFGGFAMLIAATGLRLLRSIAINTWHLRQLPSSSISRD